MFRNKYHFKNDFFVNTMQFLIILNNHEIKFTWKVMILVDL